MLAYILALVVGLGSLSLYMAAFFFPEIHRKNDFIWSGVGLFYALVLWVCAGRITGGVLLGQVAGVALLGWLGWQTVLLRRQAAPLDQQTALPSGEEVKAALENLASPDGRSQLVNQVTKTLAQIKDGVVGAISGANKARTQPLSTATKPVEVYVPPKLEDFGTAAQDVNERLADATLPPTPTDLAQASEAAQAIADQVTAPIAEMLAEGADQTATVTDQAAKTVKKTTATVKATAPKPIAAPDNRGGGAIADLPQKLTNTVKVLTETLQSLFSGFTQKKASKPVYVRKEFRESVSETVDTALDEFEATVTEPVTKRVTETIEVITEGDGAATLADAVAPVPDAVSEQVAELVETVEAVTESVSEEIAADLLGNAPPEASVEEIMEDLLEDISTQEDAAKLAAQAVPPHLPQPEIVEAAIADAEAKRVPYSPPAAEPADDSAPTEPETP